MSVVPRDPRGHSPEPWRGETYYGVPPLKRSHWGWKVGTYIALGGMAGAGQILALLARRQDRGGTIRCHAAVMGTVTAAAGAGLLIADLKTPHRFANMLRIFRPTSPMSIGTYILSAFGAASAVGAAASLRRGPMAARVAEAAQLPAAIAGAGMSVYTAALLSSTSTPLWAASAGWLGVRFGAAAFASGAAALSMRARFAGEDDTASRLDKVALVASGAGLAATLAAAQATRRAGVRHPQAGAVAAAEVLPVLGYTASAMLPRIGRDISIATSLATILGNIAMRNEVIHAGNASADRPRDYFSLAQPRDAPRIGGRP